MSTQKSLIALLLFTLTGSTARLRADSKSHAALMQEIAAAKRAGFPVTAQALQAPLPPLEQNAASVYEELDRLFKAKPLSEADKVVEFGVGMRLADPAKMEAIRQALRNRSDIVTLVHRAASRPKCVFVRDWSKGAAVLFPQFARLRSVARWLSAESALLLYDRKTLEAIRTQALGFQVARHAASDPVLVAYLVGVAVDSITQAGMERILYVAGSDPQVAEAVRTSIEQNRKPLDLVYALRGEVGNALITSEMLRKEGFRGLREIAAGDRANEEAVKPFLKDKQAYDRFMDASMVVILREMRRVIANVQRPYLQAKAALWAIAREEEAKKNDPNHILAGIILPLYPLTLDHQARSESKAATLRAAAALLAWKAKHSKLPARLSEALTPVPPDPFDGKPLRYRLEGNGFVVYSIGPTGKFEGGAPAQKPKPTETFFRYPLPGDRQ